MKQHIKLISLCLCVTWASLIQYITRMNRKQYLTAKYLSVFIAGGIVVSLPVFADLLLSAMFCPDISLKFLNQLTPITDKSFLGTIFFNDLSLTGQQIIVRCGNRRMWFLSKCVWNVLSTVLYFLMTGLTAFICTLILNGSVSINTTQEIQQIIMGNFELSDISAGQAILLGLVSPFLTLAALNISDRFTNLVSVVETVDRERVATARLVPPWM